MLAYIVLPCFAPCSCSHKLGRLGRPVSANRISFLRLSLCLAFLFAYKPTLFIMSWPRRSNAV